MGTNTVKLSQLVINDHNPRTQTREKHEQTITSLLTFPKMMKYRPVTVREDMVILGGNMRTSALRAIEKMTIEEIADRLRNTVKWGKMPDYAQDRLLSFWENWLQNPVVFINIADDFDEGEEDEFITKDNLSYGNWDTDKLANEFDEELLKEWGFDMSFFEGDKWDMLPYIDEEQQPPSLDKKPLVTVKLLDDCEMSVDEVKEVIRAALEGFSGIEIK